MLAERFADKVVMSLPDVTNTELDDPKEAGSLPDIRRKSVNRTVISLLGPLHRRKGLLKLIEISRLCDERFFFLVAGEMVWTTRQTGPRPFRHFATLRRTRIVVWDGSRVNESSIR